MPTPIGAEQFRLLEHDPQRLLLHVRRVSVLFRMPFTTARILARALSRSLFVQILGNPKL